MSGVYSDLKGNKLKNVLIISYQYLPASISGTHRSGNLAKYLPLYNWRPIVVTHLWTKENCAYDKNFVKGISTNVDVYRASTNESDTLLRTYLRKFRTIPMPQHNPYSWEKNILKILPDIFNKYRIDAIWATCPPLIAHHIASYASKRWGIPWVADIRDLWEQPSNLRRSMWPIYNWHHKKMLSNAKRIITVSDGYADRLKSRHKRDIDVILNGFDLEDLNLADSTKIEKFNIVYTGSYYHGFRRPEGVLDAIGNLIDNGYMDPDKVSIEFYVFGDKERALLRSLFENMKWKQCVKIHKPVKSDVCREITRTCAVLLLLSHPEVKGIIPAKIYEYMAARRPVLSVPKDYGGIDKLLKLTGCGVSCSNVDEISDSLLRWYKEWESTGTIKCNSSIEQIKQYSRKSQVGQIANVLDEIIT